MSPPLRILHHAGGLVAIDKPPGLAVHRGMARDPVVLVDLLAEQLGLPVFPLHRLDRATSGVLLFGLDADVARAAQAAFAEGRVEKRYLALVRGVPVVCEGLVDSPVPKGEGEPRVPARTRYRTLAVVEVPGAGKDGEPRRFALVEACPETGRFHQIRRHLKHLGHPLVGDSNYGSGPLNRFFREHVGITRLALHAAVVTIDLGASTSKLRVEAPLAPDLAEPLASLGLDLSSLG